MTNKLELKSSHEVIDTVDVADVDSIFYCKPTDPDILTVLMKDGKRLYCDEVCPVYSLQEEPVSEDLEEAAEKYAYELFPSVGVANTETELAFKAGAECGKNQAMAEIQAQSMALAHGCPEEKTSEDLKNAADNALESISDQYDIISVGSCLEMFRLGAKWQEENDDEEKVLTYKHGFDDCKEHIKEHIKEVLLSEVLPCFMHGGEADEVVAKLDEVLNQKK